MKSIRTIVGCDIKGYSNLESRKQHILTAHLEGCHIKSLAQASIEPIAFNDTGDGFYVIFERTVSIDKETTETLYPIEKYIKYLSVFYYSDKEEIITEMVSKHWLKVSFGIGEIIITGQKAIRGDGINDIARILQAAKLAVPLQLVEKHTASELIIHDKHNKKILCKPRTDLIQSKDPVFDVINNEKKDNMYYYLKQPFSGKPFSEITTSEWEEFNLYLNYSEGIKSIYKNDDDYNKYIHPIMIFGHSLKPVSKTLNEIKKKYSKNIHDIPEIRLILLDPFSDYALLLKDEKQESLRDKILESIKSIVETVKDTKVFKDKLFIKFTNKPISIGCHKILDYIFIINYGDDHLRKDANVNLYNFFGPGNDNSIFKGFIDNYLKNLWENKHSKISIAYSCKTIDDISAFYFKAATLIKSENINKENKEKLLLLKEYDYKTFLSTELLNTFYNKSEVDLISINKTVRQIEIHPSAKCNFECNFCQGKQSEHSNKALDFNKLKSYIDPIDFNNYQIQKVILSGEYSEPLLYPQIKELIKYISHEKKVPIGIYTNGSIDMTGVLNKLLKKDNYVVFNLFYSDQVVFYSINKKKSLKKDFYSNIEKTIDKNLRLIKSKITDGTLSHLNINYEINNDNLNEKNIKKFVKDIDAYEISNLSIRFNIPIVPYNHKDDINAKNETLSLSEKAIKIFIKLLPEFNKIKNIKFKFTLNPLVDNSFNKCYAFFDSIIIRSDGKISPCCYTANAKCEHLIYADIDKDSFVSTLKKRIKLFYDIDNNGRRPKYHCPACSRKDYLINSLAPQELK